MRYTLILCLLLASCAGTQTFVKSEPIATVDEVAKIKIKPNLDLPEPLNLTKYRIDLRNTKQIKDNDKNYIAIPEADLIGQESMLLELKTRILQLQRIITDAQKLM